MLHGWVMPPQRLGPRGTGAVMYSTFGPFSVTAGVRSEQRAYETAVLWLESLGRARVVGAVVLARGEHELLAAPPALLLTIARRLTSIRPTASGPVSVKPHRVDLEVSAEIAPEGSDPSRAQRG